MILTTPKEVSFLPFGDLFLRKDDSEFAVIIDNSYASSAAKFLIDKGTTKEFNSQAEIIAEAINAYKWDIGSVGFFAIVKDWAEAFNQREPSRATQKPRFPVRQHSR